MNCMMHECFPERLRAWLLYCVWCACLSIPGPGYPLLFPFSAEQWLPRTGVGKSSFPVILLSFSIHDVKAECRVVP